MAGKAFGQIWILLYAWVSTLAVVKILTELNYCKGPNEIGVKLFLVRFVNQILLRRQFLELLEVAVPSFNISP